MEKNDVIRRADDLAERCDKSGEVTFSRFLTPAEQYEIENNVYISGDCQMILFGGNPDTERKVAFFIPSYYGEEQFDPFDEIKIIRIEAFFGTPGHRDYLGALLGLGVERDCIGDIEIKENVAYVYCMRSVSNHLLTLDKVGRCGVKSKQVDREDVPQYQRRVREVNFPVMSMRMDSIVSGMFGISRSEAVRQIEMGNIFLNYSCCLKQDNKIKENDILSLRGRGKGRVIGLGGTSRKGRQYVKAEIYE